MNTGDLTIVNSEDNVETETYTFGYDASICKDTSGSQTQLKRLNQSDNDSGVLAPSRKRQKTDQSLTFPKLEESKELRGKNDVTDESQNYDDADDTEKDNGTYERNGDEANLFCVTHETQVSEGGEGDLHKHYFSCEKNPGHTQFIPVDDFDIHRMPEGFYDIDLYEYIKATADLTVRVDVKMTSTERPEFWPKTRVPYAFHNLRGKDVLRLGTGNVWQIRKCMVKNKTETCKCYKCQHSDTPSKDWGYVSMKTARHVVFDDLEARHTTCRLFFDRQDSPFVTLQDWTWYHANTEEDWCELECVTCDLDLIRKLDKIKTHWWNLWDKVIDRYKSSRDKDKLIFIVSHPHGCPKQVSVGHWIKKYLVEDDMTKYTYTTSTCPGSSGANVHTLGYDGSLYHDGHVHSGFISEGINVSGIGRDML